MRTTKVHGKPAVPASGIALQGSGQVKLNLNDIAHFATFSM